VSRGLTLTQRLARTVGSARACNDLSMGITENSSEAGVTQGGGCRAGEESGVGGVNVSSVGTCQGQAKKLDSPLAGGACVIRVSVPRAGAGAAKGIVSGRQETRESGGASGAVDEGLGVGGEPTPGVSVDGWAEVAWR
jgi:hypothetical protein